MKQAYIKSIFLSPFFLSLILCLPVIYFFQNPITPYETHIEKKIALNGRLIHLADLNQDSVDETIVIQEYQHDSSRIELYIRDGKTNSIIDQFNFDGQLGVNGESGLYFADYDNNGNKDIFLMYFRADSAFLAFFDPYTTTYGNINKVFIDKVNLFKGNINHTVRIAGFARLDKETTSWLILSLNGYFAIEPRAVYAYNIESKILKKAPRSGTQKYISQIVDLDQDGLDEILISNNSPFNIHYEIPYPDSCAWLMVYDNDLNYLFKPIKINQKFSSIHTAAYFIEGKYKLLVEKRYRNKKKQFCFVDLNGNELQQSDTITSDILYFDNKKFITRPGGLFLLDKELQITHERNLLDENEIFINIKDTHADKDINIPFYNSQTGQIGLILNNLDAKYYLPINFSPNDLIYFEGIQQATKKTFLVGNQDYSLLLSLTPNALYPFRFAYYIIVYCCTLMVVVAIQYVQRLQQKHKQQLEQEIARLQLQTIKNQMDPHFTFNAINTIGSMIMKEDKLVAYDYFTKFSDLIRSLLKNSNEIVISLQEEIDFVNDYLAIEKMRFKDKFDYHITIDEHINTKTQVPKFIIQTYAENAVKHGLMPLKDEGQLWIKVHKIRNAIGIIIADNGVGMKETKGKSTSTGKGLAIMIDFYKIFNNLYHQKIDCQIVDGLQGGTKVTLTIPVKNDKNTTDR